MIAQSQEERSRIMRAVRSKNTSPEIVVRKWLHSNGYRFRLHRSDLPGKPDIVLPKYNKIIFVHGCFWHGHNCPRGNRQPKTNTAYWKTKIHNNVTRDRNHLKSLSDLGWKTLVIWECETRQKQREKLAEKLHLFLDHEQLGRENEAPLIAAR